MGKADISLKNWFKNKRRFADLFNGTVFNGKQVVKPEELEEINGESDIIIKNTNPKDKVVQRYHDLIMRWRGKVDLAVFALESQNNISYAMPVREMVYNGLAYTDQMSNIWNSLSEGEKKSNSTAEFFSRLRKQDKLCPVISIVFYYGENDWDAPTSLYDMFEITDKDMITALNRYVPNHRINLIDTNNIDDVTRFKSDLHIIFGMLQCRNDKDKFVNYTNEHSDYFQHMDYESQQVVASLLNARKVLDKVMNNKEGEQNMCKALQDLYDDGIEQGEQNKLRELILRKIQKNKSLEQIADELEESIEVIKPIYDKCLMNI